MTYMCMHACGCMCMHVAARTYMCMHACGCMCMHVAARTYMCMNVATMISSQDSHCLNAHLQHECNTVGKA